MKYLYKEYILVNSIDTYGENAGTVSLEETTTSFLKKGWELWGSPFSDNEGVLYQAMIKRV
tara:strand:+ start:276 stop:458 length:183 start_codon:yes stop_codon:yes gene_type:complete